VNVSLANTATVVPSGGSICIVQLRADRSLGMSASTGNAAHRGIRDQQLNTVYSTSTNPAIPTQASSVQWNALGAQISAPNNPGAHVSGSVFLASTNPTSGVVSWHNRTWYRKTRTGEVDETWSVDTSGTTTYIGTVTSPGFPIGGASTYEKRWGGTFYDYASNVNGTLSCTYNSATVFVQTTDADEVERVHEWFDAVPVSMLISITPDGAFSGDGNGGAAFEIPPGDLMPETDDIDELGNWLTDRVKRATEGLTDLLWPLHLLDTPGGASF